MRKLWLSGLLLFISVLGACSNNQDSSRPDEKTDRKDELILAIGGETDEGFDPTTGWGMYGSPLFQSTLLTYDKDFSIQNDLAANLEVSSDGLQYTVEIRDDVKFSDGEPLTSEDVAFTFETAKNSGSVIDLSNLNEVETSGDYAVKFTLKQPDSTFSTRLATIGIVPKHAYDDNYNENPIGSGPYQMVQWSRGQQLIVESNPHYYGTPPKFKKLTFLFLEEDATLAAAKAGEVDVAAITPSFAKQDVAGMRLERMDTVDNRGIVFPYVKTGGHTKDGAPVGNDVTADPTIRKAIDIGIDRKALVDGILDGFGTPAYSVADNLPWWNPETAVTDNQLEKAQKMLTDAGWIENEDGVREKDHLKAAFTLLYPAGDEIRQSLSIAVAEQIKELGIKVKTEGKSWSDLGNLMYSNPVMMGWGSHDPLEMYNIHSSQTRGEGFYNVNYYSNPAADDYMEKAMRSTTQEEANMYWQKAQWDGKTGFSSKGDTPWVWLVNLQHIYLVNDDLDIGDQKLQPHGHGWPITDFIEQWHWK
ncbi:nickel ABC transporter substrate-binding protein [Sporosarcina sp. P37]|uniref:ABC transporter substrate-binding protein n=1 Tax=unclassified Sporosarcina TaxID=2647733 RepID=UPI000A17DEF7|nr:MULTISPECIES: ABC transporter substrate-binding protein [unclassified Sporosarcina]ARK24612.1 nickel ABC transporter substrate-binding protein [Sporosarcina sp. P37]PID19770.1 nickel ABC transporter substrate-binding protein [Sporosarcina sp. P35]